MVSKKKRQPPSRREGGGLDALQDAGANASRLACAERLGVRRSSAALPPHFRAQPFSKFMPRKKTPEGWTHSKTLARMPAAPACAERLGVRRPSAALRTATRDQPLPLLRRPIIWLERRLHEPRHSEFFLKSSRLGSLASWR